MLTSTGKPMRISKKSLDCALIVAPGIKFWTNVQKSSVADLSILTYHLSLTGFTLQTNSCPANRSRTVLGLIGSDSSEGNLETIIVAWVSVAAVGLGSWGKFN